MIRNIPNPFAEAPAAACEHDIVIAGPLDIGGDEIDGCFEMTCWFTMDGDAVDQIGIVSVNSFAMTIGCVDSGPGDLSTQFAANLVRAWWQAQSNRDCVETKLQAWWNEHGKWE